ncbi:hypothetical protein FRX31_006929 [Thalictrum thalictroides]|uniref:VQ domain-containing protein n=1 Tax=Thalictrum thalictroides TaxID=46969 RepID=A0A7J6X1D5_THATH|nr:hypothetical protein FRX31_006929 [Thalictrum thalictroides]
MDKFRVQPNKMMNKQSTQVKRKPMKIVYIGNPMMFKANNCFEFRQIVQELTGKDSGRKSTSHRAGSNNVPIMNKTPTHHHHKTPEMIATMDEISDHHHNLSNSTSSTSSVEFVDDFFSLEMLQSVDGFPYPFLDL